MNDIFIKANSILTAFCLDYVRQRPPGRMCKKMAKENYAVVDFMFFFTVHLGSFLVNNQLDAQFFFRIYLFQFSTCFDHPCAHHQENQLY